MRPSIRLAFSLAMAAAVAPAQISHRASQSPVKNQGGRGTCAAFAVCAALETLPGVPLDLSEQLLYATRKLREKEVDRVLTARGYEGIGDEGNVFADYLGLFTVFGTCHESVVPYSPNPLKVLGEIPEDLRTFLERGQMSEQAVRDLLYSYGLYGFGDEDVRLLDEPQIRDRAAIERLLDGGVLAIPVGYRVHGPNWYAIAEKGRALTDSTPRIIIHPGMLYRFRRPGGEPVSHASALLESIGKGESFVEAVQRGDWQQVAYPGDPDDYGGHAVTIVGYDDVGVWIKNSWGEDWGDGGYALVSWDYHCLYATRGMVIERPRIRHPNVDPFQQKRLLEKGAMRLKIQPQVVQGGDPRWSLSVFHLERRAPQILRVTYRIEIPKVDGGWQTFAENTVEAPSSSVSTGFPWLVDAPQRGPVRMTAVVADDLWEFTKVFGPIAIPVATVALTQRED